MINSDSAICIKDPSSLINIATSKLFQSQVRETLKIGFLYVKNDQLSQNDILKNSWNDTSESFRSFVKSIGTIVDLSVHTGFNGKLDSTNFSNGRYHLYYSDQRFEVLYHVAPLIPTDPKDDQQIYKKRHIGNDNIHIVWTENPLEYDPTTISSQFNDAHVIIHPTKKNGFYRVRIYKKNEAYLFGPLQGETIVSMRALPELVRWTSIFSDRAARKLTSTVYKLPSLMFEEALNDIKNSKREN
ncbi:Rap/ran-GAP family protein [Histomonas meleagridis]|uniref:Rap/ran-GAP family protein n=1 Tax=Histomonas meleagridis TaxID=135588 RepID=UPI00355A05BF|nr:Rap/ran-GAP family protein [Histomonas meleagridis]KAH0799015.1 Rap/ran-GAP family protein [Histomonas meleagridis]